MSDVVDRRFAPIICHSFYLSKRFNTLTNHVIYWVFKKLFRVSRRCLIRNRLSPLKFFYQSIFLTQRSLRGLRVAGLAHAGWFLRGIKP